MRVQVSAVFEQAGEILCMRYVYGGKDVYAIPGGGVGKNTLLHDTLIDEWKTELGVKVTVGNILLVGEAPATKRHTQTLHIIFEATDVRGTPKVRPDSTHSLDVAWVPINQLETSPLYPDVGKQLFDYFQSGRTRSIAFTDNCMERGYW